MIKPDKAGKTPLWPTRQLMKQSANKQANKAWFIQISVPFQSCFAGTCSNRDIDVRDVLQRETCPLRLLNSSRHTAQLHIINVITGAYLG